MQSFDFGAWKPKRVPTSWVYGFGFGGGKETHDTRATAHGVYKGSVGFHLSLGGSPLFLWFGYMCRRPFVGGVGFGVLGFSVLGFRI